MGLQAKEKFPFLKNDQKSLTSLLRVTEVLPLFVPLWNQLQKIFWSKIYKISNPQPNPWGLIRRKMARKWSSFLPLLTPCAQTGLDLGPCAWSSEVPLGQYQITPQPHWSGFPQQFYAPKTKTHGNRGQNLNSPIIGPGANISPKGVMTYYFTLGQSNLGQ